MHPKRPLARYNCVRHIGRRNTISHKIGMALRAIKCHNVVFSM